MVFKTNLLEPKSGKTLTNAAGATHKIFGLEHKVMKALRNNEYVEDKAKGKLICFACELYFARKVFSGCECQVLLLLVFTAYAVVVRVIL